MVAARATSQPVLSLADLSAQMRDRCSRLDVLDAADPLSNVRAVFSWTCVGPSGPAARMFRLLGIHPGPDIAAAAAASLCGVPVAESRLLPASRHHGNYLCLTGRWDEFATANRSALAAARRLGDQQMQARAHRRLGHALAQMGSGHSGHTHLHQALRLFEAVGDDVG